MKLNMLVAAMIGLTGLNEHVPDVFSMSVHGAPSSGKARHTGAAKARREKKARKRRKMK